MTDGYFLTMANAIRDAKQENETLVEEYEISNGDLRILKDLKQRIFTLVVRKGHGRFDPEVIRQHIDTEFYFG